MTIQSHSLEEVKEMSMIEITYILLSESKKTLSFDEIVQQISTILDISPEVMNERISQLYTDVNIDGRFIALADDQIDLRSRYPFEQYEDETLTSSTKPKKKRTKKALLEEADEVEEFEDDFDAFDEEEEEEDVLADEEAVDEDEDEDEDDDTYVDTDDFDAILPDDEFDLEDNFEDDEEAIDEEEEEK